MIPIDFKPSNAKELEEALLDPMWRICSGHLYKILLKQRDDEDGGMVAPFRPYPLQMKFLNNVWFRNVVCKARQHGYTTLISLMWLDHALFVPDQRCGVIAQTEKHAQGFFRDKILFAYKNLPEEIKKRFPIATQRADELLFAHNNSSIQVAVSLRSGTIHRLHISEYGYICQKHPDKAEEIISGSIPAVPNDGIVIIESTAEGKDGDFAQKVEQARAIQERNLPLSPKNYRLHFCAWWENPHYQMDAEVEMTPKDEEYFSSVEALTGTSLNEAQRKWYVSTKENDFSGDEERMWRQYPSTIEEPFQVSTEGKYFAKQMSALRKQGRIASVPYSEGLPVHTAWDIGGGDGTAIWCFQEVGAELHFINFFEGWNEPYSYFIRELQGTGYIWGLHLLPHDAEHKRQSGERMLSALDVLRALSIGGKWKTIKRVTDLSVGINEARTLFGRCRFDAKACSKGLKHLELYSKSWNEKAGSWSDHPLKNEHTEAADAFRQIAQFKAKHSFPGQSIDKPEQSSNIVQNIYRESAGGWMSL